MKLNLTSLVLFLFVQITFGQKDTIFINGSKFIAKKQTIKTEYDRRDTLLKLYRVDSGKAKYVLRHYLYKYGADAENEFEDIGTIQIRGDSLILKTHYLQKGRLRDPIPEWRKRIYRVTSSGELLLLYDKSKNWNSNKWTKTDYFDD